jgi:hypothetical protein
MLVLFITLAAAVVTPQHYEFDDDEVQADARGPEGSVTTASPRIRRASLIHVRTHFLDELIRSANR